MWTFNLRFICPAFLGDAEQKSELRAPPIKWLLRHWWRVCYAANLGYTGDVSAMRADEHRLFGAATGGADGNGGQSRVRIRIGKWRAGSLGAAAWENLPPVRHPEVNHGQAVPADLYLGYGPVINARGGARPTTLKSGAAIHAGEQVELRIALDPRVGESFQIEQQRIARALALMNLYGTLGGRGRNAWGSFVLEPFADQASLATPTPTRDWEQCLGLDWPHAIGQDAKGPLVWASHPVANWKLAMNMMARLRLGMRTQFMFARGNTPTPEPRHWLAYPAGAAHQVATWGREARLPNSLRLRLRASPDGLRVVAFHMPALPPPAFAATLHRAQIVDTWQAVHSLLDQLALPAAARTYPRVANAARRTDITNLLNGVSLTRSAQ